MKHALQFPKWSDASCKLRTIFIVEPKGDSMGWKGLIYKRLISCKNNDQQTRFVILKN